ncbi:MAG TPA: AbrB family transcriptional regulator [Lentisphaeria bacterium]|nr:MAG: AbrB family transcriptional regulator [Lentisphaerae bacterium GWF2_38_69]HBM16357.1 AbrB family transcriptional regulator [Lentisphaeria bacterium]
MLSTLTSKGQITIPVEIRKKLGLHTGNKVNFIFKNNVVEIVPTDISVKSLKGIVPKPANPVTIEEMNKAIEDYHGRN